MSDTPNPGSDKALARGCTCAVLDNAHGAEWEDTCWAMTPMRQTCGNWSWLTA